MLTFLASNPYTTDLNFSGMETYLIVVGGVSDPQTTLYIQADKALDAYTNTLGAVSDTSESNSLILKSSSNTATADQIVTEPEPINQQTLSSTAIISHNLTIHPINEGYIPLDDNPVQNAIIEQDLVVSVEPTIATSQSDSDYHTVSTLTPHQSLQGLSKHDIRRSNIVKTFKVKSKFLSTKAVYFFYYGARAIFFANFMVFLQSIGLGASHAGLIQGVMMVTVTLTASLWGLLADKTQRYFTILCIQLVMSGLLSQAMPLALYLYPPVENAHDFIGMTEPILKTAGSIYAFAAIKNGTGGTFSRSIMMNATVVHIDSRNYDNSSNMPFGPINEKPNNHLIFAVMMGMSIAYAIFGSGVSIIIDSLVLTLTKKASKGTGTFGRQRLFGSIAFAIFPVLAGMLTEACHYEQNIFLPAFSLISGLQICLIISCVYLVKVYHELIPSSHNQPIEEITPASQIAPSIDPITDDILDVSQLECTVVATQTSIISTRTLRSCGLRSRLNTLNDANTPSLLNADASHLRVSSNVAATTSMVSTTGTIRSCGLRSRLNTLNEANAPSLLNLDASHLRVSSNAAATIESTTGTLRSCGLRSRLTTLDESKVASLLSVTVIPISAASVTVFPAVDTYNVLPDTTFWSNLKQPSVLIYMSKILLIGICGGTQFAVVYLMMNDMKASKTLMGMTILFQCTVETMTMPAGTFIATKLRSNSIAMVCGVMGYSAAFFCFYFIQDPIMVIPVCMLFGVSYAVFYSASMDELYRITQDQHVTTMVGVYTACYSGVGFAIASVACGALYDIFGPRMTLVSMAGLLAFFSLLHLAHAIQVEVAACRNRLTNVKLDLLTKELGESPPCLFNYECRRDSAEPERHTGDGTDAHARMHLVSAQYSHASCCCRDVKRVIPEVVIVKSESAESVCEDYICADMYSSSWVGDDDDAQHLVTQQVGQ